MLSFLNVAYHVTGDAKYLETAKATIKETDILNKLATNTSRDSVANSLGIPVAAVVQLLRKKGVKEWLTELKMARKEQMITYAAEVVAATLQDKMAMIEEEV